METYSFKSKCSVVFAFAVAYGVFYLYPNMFAGFEVHQLPLLWIDNATPFLPPTFLIYMSDYFIFVFVILLHRNRNEFHHLSRMCFLTLLSCGLFFLLYPTIYPRPVYPLVENSIVQFAMNTIQKLDSPKNCFPSMHVALTGVATYSIRGRSKPLFYFFLVWTGLIYISTMTTKQHYFVDLLGGMAIVVAVAYAEMKFMSKQRWFFPNG